MKNDPAFPYYESWGNEHGLEEHRNHLGLTKLEWFAGMVASNVDGEAINMAAQKFNSDSVRIYAAYCFEIAEAMLKESEKREQDHGNEN